jgi:hypothetical protein
MNASRYERTLRAKTFSAQWKFPYTQLFEAAGEAVERDEHAEAEIQAEQRDQHEHRHLERDHCFDQQPHDQHHDADERQRYRRRDLQFPGIGHVSPAIQSIIARTASCRTCGSRRPEEARTWNE